MRRERQEDEFTESKGFGRDKVWIERGPYTAFGTEIGGKKIVIAKYKVPRKLKFSRINERTPAIFLGKLAIGYEEKPRK